MRRRIDPLPFSPQYSFVCFKTFKYEDHQYINGDPFPLEGVEKPAATLLEKLYRQKLITVAEAPAQEAVQGAKPVLTKAQRKAAAKAAEEARKAAAAEAREAARVAQEAAAEAEKARLAAEAESAQALAASQENVNDDDGANDPGTDGDDAPADAPADDAAPGAAEPALAAGDAGGSGPVAGADSDGASAPADQSVGAVTFVGPLKRVYTGFAGHNVVDAKGAVYREGIKSKDEADAIVAAGLPTE